MRALLLISLFLAGCAREPVDPSATADQFFKLISAGNTQSAYEMGSFQFKAEQSFPRFELMLRENGLLGTPPVRWTQRISKGQEIVLRGELLPSQLQVALTLGVHKGDWQIMALSLSNASNPEQKSSFSLLGSGVGFTDVANMEVPQEPVINEAVQEALLAFNEAVQKKSFQSFSNVISRSWRSQLTETRFFTAFQAWLDAGIDFGGIRGMRAVFSEPPRFNSSGLLVVKGFYDTAPTKLLFSMQFINEMPKWRLVSLELSLADTAKSTSDRLPELK